MARNLATFRFYEELNDLLPPDKRKQEFPYSFTGSPSIKDAIEALGIPHVEVDLILINGKSVNFHYHLKQGDRVSVYPVFETLNISGVSHLRSRPLRRTTFIADVHLGKLAGYLRMAGLDTLYNNDYRNDTIIEIAVAEGRTILTRNVHLLKVKVVTHGYRVRSQEPKQQLREVLEHFDLFQNIRPFQLCIRCNAPLKSVRKEEIREKLQPLTEQYFNEFRKCPHCERIYWEGTHYERMRFFLKAIVDGRVL